MVLLAFTTYLAAQTPSPVLTTLYNFKGYPNDGWGPQGVAIGSRGVLYGTTGIGGTRDLGTVYSLTLPASPGGAWTEKVLYTFPGYRGDGAEPDFGLAIGCGPTGRPVFYGTTALSGRINLGTVFSLAAPSSAGGQWTEALVYTFRGVPPDGSDPVGGLVRGRNGVLYGTTYVGGTSYGGTVFSLTPPSSPRGAWTETVLYNFGSVAGDGGNPNGVVLDSEPEERPVFYGTTFGGGASNFGTVFSVAPPAGIPFGSGGPWQETVLYSFQGGSDGYFPGTGVTIGSGPTGHRVLYGMTAAGGTSNGGTVFSLTPPASPGGAWTETVIYQFPPPSTYGYAAPIPLVPGRRGLLYGATLGVGSGGGTLFALQPPASPGGAWTKIVLHTFTGTEGANTSGLVMGGDGVLYGTTAGGGVGYGTVFSLKP